MGLRDGFESEKAKLDAAKAAREEQDRKRVEAAERLQETKTTMLREVADAFVPDIGFLEECGVTISKEVGKLLLRGPRGTVSIAVEQQHGASLEYVIQTFAQRQLNIPDERSETVEAVLSKVGRAVARIQS